MEKSVKVCVTGGAGYLASFLIKHLLQRGYTVHATLRSLSDASKVGVLKGLADAETRLKLFEADIYNPAEFEAASYSRFESTSEAAVGGVRIIVESCMRSNTVKRLIYTAKDVVDESCWTPLNHTYDMFADYIKSKTLAEKEVLGYDGKGIEVVSLGCGLVGGETIQSFVPESMAVLISQAMNDGLRYKGLRALEDLVSKLPIVHIQDVIEAHIFSMENSDINGRFLVASSFLKSAEIASLIHKHFPDITIPPELIEDTERETKWGSRKLEDLGFRYKFDADKIIYDSIVCAKRLGTFI